jgi:hypothetical protein
MIIFSFYFMQYILCNWKSVVMYIDKKDDLKDVLQHFKFRCFWTYIIKLITKDNSVQHDNERLSITFCSDETTEDVTVQCITFMKSILLFVYDPLKHCWQLKLKYGIWLYKLYLNKITLAVV